MNKKKVAIEETTTKIAHQYISFPKETLGTLLDEKQDILELPVREFFDRFLNSTSHDINTEEMLLALIENYNQVVRAYRNVTKNSLTTNLRPPFE